MDLETYYCSSISVHQTIHPTWSGDIPFTSNHVTCYATYVTNSVMKTGQNQYILTKEIKQFMAKHQASQTIHHAVSKGKFWLTILQPCAHPAKPEQELWVYLQDYHGISNHKTRINNTSMTDTCLTLQLAMTNFQTHIPSKTWKWWKRKD